MAGVRVLRTGVSLPLGLLTIDWFHWVAERVVPGAYLPGNDVAFLPLVLVTGMAGCIVAFSVTGHRSWVYTGVFLLAMAVVDAMAVMGDLAGRPLWFRAGVMVSLPLQVWVGMLFRYTPRSEELRFCGCGGGVPGGGARKV